MLSSRQPCFLPLLVVWLLYLADGCSSQVPNADSNSTPGANSGSSTSATSCSGEFLVSCDFENCIVVGQMPKCTKCKEGYYLTTENTCSRCSANCLSCSAISGNNASICRACSQGCNLVGGFCDCNVSQPQPTDTRSTTGTSEQTDNSKNSSSSTQAIFLALGCTFGGIILLGFCYIVWKKVTSKVHGKVSDLINKSNPVKTVQNTEIVTTVRSKLGKNVPDIELLSKKPSVSNLYTDCPDILVRQAASFVTAEDSPKRMLGSLAKTHAPVSKNQTPQSAPRRLRPTAQKLSNSKST